MSGGYGTKWTGECGRAWLALVVFCITTLVSQPSIAQTSLFYNFDGNTSSGTLYMRGSLTAASPLSAPGAFTGLSSSATDVYGSPVGTTPLTAYDVVSSQGFYTFNSTTTYGTYAAGSGGKYYVSNLDFGFTTSDGKYYRLQGGPASSGSASFDLYQTTTSAYSLTGATRLLNNTKIVSLGTASGDGTFTQTAADVPEIDGGILPKSLLLFFSLVAIATRYRHGKLHAFTFDQHCSLTHGKQ